VPRGNSPSESIRLLDRPGGAAEVASLDAAVDVDYALHVVMVDYGRLDVLANRGMFESSLLTTGRTMPAAGVSGVIPSACTECTYAGNLLEHAVVDPIFGIEPVGRLESGPLVASPIQQVGCNIALIDAEFQRALPDRRSRESSDNRASCAIRTSVRPIRVTRLDAASHLIVDSTWSGLCRCASNSAPRVAEIQHPG